MVIIVFQPGCVVGMESNDGYYYISAGTCSSLLFSLNTYGMESKEKSDYYVST